MRFPPVFGSIVAVTICFCGYQVLAREPAAVAGAVVPGPGSLSGIWTNVVYKHSSVYNPREGVLRPDDGSMPPLQPWAAQLLEQRIKAADAGHPFANTKSACLPSGVPQLMFGPATPIQILETPGQVTILIEEFNNFRIIRLNEKHVEDPDPTFMGDSVGHWEGGTLVVDTIGLMDRTTLDVAGMPHSEALHVVERFRRKDKDMLEVVVTMDDPKTFTRPWTVTTGFKPLAPGLRMMEFLCENQRNAGKDGVTTMKMYSTNK